MDTLKISTVVIIYFLLVLVGCECQIGDEKCEGKYYHMKCVESDLGGGNWTLENNCLDT